MFELRDQSWGLQLGVVTLYRFGRRDVANRPHQAPVIEPVNPFKGSEFDSLEGPPGSTRVNQFGLVKTIDRLG